MQYTKEDLCVLHQVLYEILSDIHRVCAKNNIQYFLIGGSAIGLYYDNAILPWDDDLDIGMKRDDFNKFVAVAKTELKEDYFLSFIETDPNTPFFYAKVKKNNTLFVEGSYKDVPMHQGIFVDVFPIDRLPKNKIMRKLQYKLANFLKCCFMSKEVWMWDFAGRCEIDTPLPRSKTSCLLNWIVNKLMTKQQIYHFLVLVSSMFKSSSSHLWGNAITETDYVYEDELATIKNVPYGPIVASSVPELYKYLKRNFPNLHRYTPDEVQTKVCNHSPLVLSFKE